ncbi:MAG TPA: NAD-dependent epimerase/dehydratase family protein [Stellaceae bacterium]|nr:NAD-dependent epimerase/dehydratase family protein [Stellaceae bacterium]
MVRILVTGAPGFIGRALCLGLVGRGHAVLGLSRRPAEPIRDVELRPIGDIGPATDWSGHLDGIEIVVHLATRAHRSRRGPADHNEAQAARVLAHSAAKAGVRRLIHMSSVRAMGEATLPGAPFRASDPPRPRDPYGRGKLAIERALFAAAQETGIEIVILRPPLVYGPGVKANFRALLRLVASGLPLPLAGIDNRRSLMFVDNLVDLVGLACQHPGAAGRVLLARDSADLSTSDLIRLLAAGLGRPARLFDVPQPALAVFRRLPMLGPLLARLTLSLQVDDVETRAALDWRPPVSPATGLAATATAFRGRS